MAPVFIAEGKEEDEIADRLDAGVAEEPGPAFADAFEELNWGVRGRRWHV